MTLILTVGHSTHSIEAFIDLLQAHGVKRLVDVRSFPRPALCVPERRTRMSEYHYYEFLVTDRPMTTKEMPALDSSRHPSSAVLLP